MFDSRLLYHRRGNRNMMILIGREDDSGGP